MKFLEKIGIVLICIFAIIGLGYSASEVTNINVLGWLNVTGVANFTGNVTMLGDTHGTYLNWSCFNPGCTARIYDNGTDLIIERV